MWLRPRSVLRERLSKDMHLLELGPLAAPIVPKREGWNTCVVDRESREDLLSTFYYLGSELQKIEDIDVIWQAGLIHDAFSANEHRTFDAIVVSHVLEHLIDPISFFQSASKLLKPTGELLLLLPDKRFSFDYFRPITLTGDLFDAYRSKLKNHERRTAFNHLAYGVTKRGLISWDLSLIKRLEFICNLEVSMQRADAHAGPDGLPNYDFHAWCFVPSSFELIALELLHLNLIDFSVEVVSQAFNGEFFVAMKASEGRRLSLDNLAQQRLRLLRQIFVEIDQQTRFARVGGLLGAWHLALVSDIIIAGFEASINRLRRVIGK
jgi:SAM-dependent methyltransferase